MFCRVGSPGVRKSSSRVAIAAPGSEPPRKCPARAETGEKCRQPSNGGESVLGGEEKSVRGHVVTARSCCLEMLLFRVVWAAAQASRLLAGGLCRGSELLMNLSAW